MGRGAESLNLKSVGSRTPALPELRRQQNMEQDPRHQHPAFINTCHDQVLREDRILENLFLSESFYIKSNQKSLSRVFSEHRRLLTEWMLEICQVNQNSNQVFLSAVSFLDTISSRLLVKSSQLQSLAAACLCISSKIRDPQPLSLRAFLSLPGVSLASLQEMELTVLARISWDLASPTSLDFLPLVWSRISRGCDFPTNVTRQLFEHAETYLVLAATEQKYYQRNPSLMVTFSEYMPFGRFIINLDNFQAGLSILSGYKCVIEGPTLENLLMRFAELFRISSENLTKIHNEFNFSVCSWLEVANNANPGHNNNLVMS